MHCHWTVSQQNKQTQTSDADTSSCSRCVRVPTKLCTNRSDDGMLQQETRGPDHMDPGLGQTLVPAFSPNRPRERKYEGADPPFKTTQLPGENKITGKGMISMSWGVTGGRLHTHRWRLALRYLRSFFSRVSR